MATGSLKITIISDLHCCLSSEDEDYRTTNLYCDSPRKPSNHHPVESLLKLIKEKKLRSDILLCPGDLTNKASKEGFSSAWSYVHEINTALKSKLLAATLGNHDVDSKFKHSEDAFEIARSIKNSFPVNEEKHEKDFWKDSFCIIEKPKLDLLIFNSSYSHINSDNAKYCIIEPFILEKMEDKLKLLKRNKPYKIALCHHHPMKHSNLDYKDNDSIEQGDNFIRLLDKYGFQIIIHGHKHDPRLTYGINGFPVLASGSFSSLMNQRETGYRNIFHQLTLLPNLRKGLLESYEFSLTHGWFDKRAMFPKNTGFGCHDNLDDLANKCKDWLNSQDNKDSAYFKNLIIDIPEIKYLIPDHSENFKDLLLKNHKIDIVQDAIYKQF